MLDYPDQAVDFLEFWSSIGFQRFIRFFWIFVLLEFPRYVVLDFAGLLITRVARFRRRIDYEAARERLFAERPLVSVLAPGKDEGDNIGRLVRALSEQTYSNLKIIIVDDGSSDHTPQICRRFLRDGRIHRFLRNDIRGGKASAANFGLRYSTGRFVVHVDADCSFDRDALEKVLIPFYLDERTGAVSGNLKVRNATRNIATALQAIEYLKSISIGRRVNAMMGVLRLVSGAFGAFRRDVLDQVGGWEIGPGLDGDVTVKIRKSGYRIVFEPDVIGYTSVPKTFFQLARQRLRWSRSIVRFRVRKHRDVYLPSAAFSWSNLLSFVENVFYTIVLNVLWIVYFIDILVSFPSAAKYIIPANYLLYLCVNIVEFGAVIWALERKREELRLAAYLPLVPPYINFFLRSVRTTAYFQEFFYKASYLDPWNPRKVSEKARQLGF